MNGASTAAAATTDAFASAMEKAAEMTRYLGSQQSFAATHSELESFVAEEGRKLLRRMLQGHHELRALAEQPVRVEGADRVLRTFLRPSGRPVVSIVGRVDIGRFAYQARGVDGIDEIHITAKPDQLLVPLPEGASYLGFIFARAATADLVTQALRDAHARLAFTIDVHYNLVHG